jgi:biotin operon repressor
MRRQMNGQMYVWLHVFSCAARHLSFTRCAEELHITPGAVSQQIRQLEERLGFRLFLRRARGVELSAEGQRLAQTVSEAYGDPWHPAPAFDPLVPGQVADPAPAASAATLSGHPAASGGRGQ